MTHSEPNDPLTLLQRSAKLKLFAMLRRTIDGDALQANLGDHLRWMIREEKARRIVLSGPTAKNESATVSLNGLTVIAAADLDEAKTLAAADPLVIVGAVAFDIFEWTVNEGSLTFTVTISDSSVTFQ